MILAMTTDDWRDDESWMDDLPRLRPSSATELWKQLADALAVRILAGATDRPLPGAIPWDTKFWAEVDLAERLRISRGTVIRALTALKDDHLLVQVPGRGLFTPTKEDLDKIIQDRQAGEREKRRRA